MLSNNQIKKFASAEEEALILEWQLTDEQLTRVKQRELELRNEVIKTIFKNYKETGVENFDLNQGYKLKATFKINYSLNNKDDAVDKALTKIENIGQYEKFVAAKLIQWKPQLVLSEYKELSEECKKIIDEVITTSNGTPSLELVSPKK